MPELPEIETIARGLRPRLEGAVIAAVRVGRRDYVRCPPPSASVHLAGKRIRTILRHGKRLQFGLAPDGEFTVHLGMSGRLGLETIGTPVGKHTHLRIAFRGQDLELRLSDPRRFGGVRVRPRRTDAPPDLGPDALAIRLPAFRKLLSRPRQIKALLLDQRAIAGLGNIYCDEALFAAGIHPRTRASDLDDDARRRALRQIRRVLGRAIRDGGSTIRDYRDAAGDAGRFQRRHRVYGRDGRPCPRCGAPIVRIVVASRSTHVCPECQPPAGGGRIRPRGGCRSGP